MSFARPNTTKLEKRREGGGGGGGDDILTRFEEFGC